MFVDVAAPSFCEKTTPLRVLASHTVTKTNKRKDTNDRVHIVLQIVIEWNEWILFE